MAQQVNTIRKAIRPVFTGTSWWCFSLLLLLDYHKDSTQNPISFPCISVTNLSTQLRSLFAPGSLDTTYQFSAVFVVIIFGQPNVQLFNYYIKSQDSSLWCLWCHSWYVYGYFFRVLAISIHFFCTFIVHHPHWMLITASTTSCMRIWRGFKL